jgi:sulfate transport system permease protein
MTAAASVGGRALRAAVFAYVGALVVLPLLVILWRGIAGGREAWSAALFESIPREALYLSFKTSALAAVVNGVLGTLTAWALVRWRFPGRKLLSSLVDLPLALPTLLAGLMIVVLYGPRTFLGERMEIAFATPGIVLALLFVTFPLTVRPVEAVLHQLDPAEEEAARILGASRWTTFRRVTLPALLPAIASGTAQSFARALAEFGSIVVVSSNMPLRTLTAPVFVYGEVEAGHTEVAAAASIVLLAAALLTVLATRTLLKFLVRAHAI